MNCGKCWRLRSTVVWHHGWSMQWNVDFLFFECMFSHKNIHKNSVKCSVIYICAFFSFPASYIEIVQKSISSRNTLILDSVHHLSNVQLLQLYTVQWAEFKRRVFMSVVHPHWIPIELNKLVCCCWFKYCKLASSKQNWSSVAVSYIPHSLHICILFVVARLCQQSGSVVWKQLAGHFWKLDIIPHLLGMCLCTSVT